MSSIVIDAYAALQTDFTQAFVYPDACFMLAFLDSDDSRGDDVASLIDLWKDCDVILGISTHVYQEVVGVLFRNTVLRSLEIQSAIESGRKKVHSLNPHEHDDLVKPDGAQFIYKVARQTKMIDDRGRFKGSVSELMKRAKDRILERQLLQPYYSSASQQYNDFQVLLQTSFNLSIKVLETDHNILNTANFFTHLLQLDPTDAIHYAIAVDHNCDYLVTLDGDFLNATYENIPYLKTNIIKVA